MNKETLILTLIFCLAVIGSAWLTWGQPVSVLSSGLVEITLRAIPLGGTASGARTWAITGGSMTVTDGGVGDITAEPQGKEETPDRVDNAGLTQRNSQPRPVTGQPIYYHNSEPGVGYMVVGPDCRVVIGGVAIPDPVPCPWWLTDYEARHERIEVREYEDARCDYGNFVPAITCMHGYYLSYDKNGCLVCIREEDPAIVSPDEMPDRPPCGDHDYSVVDPEDWPDGFLYPCKADKLIYSTKEGYFHCEKGKPMSGHRHVSFILDETGSMQSRIGQVISGFSEFVGSLRRAKSAKRVRFTLTKFNSNATEIVHDAVKLKDVPDLTRETYRPDWNTPLYDAIGRTIRSLEKKVEADDGVLVVIQTDGLENDSREYTQQGISELIQQKKEEGWEFVFLGADQDAWDTGGSLSINASNTLSYDSVDTHSTFVTTGNASAHWVDAGEINLDAGDGITLDTTDDGITIGAEDDEEEDPVHD